MRWLSCRRLITPPPNDPPPPEKPPPPDEPPQPPPQPGPMITGPFLQSRVRRTRPAGTPPPGRRMSARTLRMIISAIRPKKARTIISAGSMSCVALARAARCLYSSASPVSTCTTSCAPRLMPPGKSPARKRGRIEFWMMKFEIRSVSVPSRPYPTSMRTLRSFGATISNTPLFLSFWPICHWRPS